MEGTETPVWTLWLLRLPVLAVGCLPVGLAVAFSSFFFCPFS